MEKEDQVTIDIDKKDMNASIGINMEKLNNMSMLQLLSPKQPRDLFVIEEKHEHDETDGYDALRNAAQDRV